MPQGTTGVGTLSRGATCPEDARGRALLQCFRTPAPRHRHCWYGPRDQTHASPCGSSPCQSAVCGTAFPVTWLRACRPYVPYLLGRARRQTSISGRVCRLVIISVCLGGSSARQEPGCNVQVEGSGFGMAHWKQIPGGSRGDLGGVEYQCLGCQFGVLVTNPSPAPDGRVSPGESACGELQEMSRARSRTR